MSSIANGDRYFFIPKVLLLWLLVVLLQKRPASLFAVLALIFFVNVPQFRFPGYAQPDWPAYAARMRAGENLTVPIAPEGMTFVHEGTPRPGWKAHDVRASVIAPALFGGVLAGALLLALVRRGMLDSDPPAHRTAKPIRTACVLWVLVAATAWVFGGISLRIAALLLLILTFRGAFCEADNRSRSGGPAT